MKKSEFIYSFNHKKILNKKTLFVIPIILGIFVVFFFSFEKFENIKYDYLFHDEEFIFYAFGNEGEHAIISENGNLYWTSFKIELIPEFQKLYDEIGVFKESQKTVVVYPIFTASAYSPFGFYDYYKNSCDVSCLTTKIDTSFVGTASGNAFQVFSLLGYDVITDVSVDTNPNILKKYDKVIVLHNEYVTKIEFDAFNNHPRVMYLYPNANYAEISVDYEQNSITLLSGHGFPDQNISNGFNWQFDNSPLEYNTECIDWKFYEIDNGVMLDCYPEKQILKDAILLKWIKEWS